MIKILAIGNSFSQDATTYLHQIASAHGVELKVANLYIGGCSLDMHIDNIRNNAQEYSYELNGSPTGKYVSIKEALMFDQWDYVTMQQVSKKSIDYSTYQPYLRELSDYVKKYAPQAEQLIHQTWAYEQDSDRLKELGYQDQYDMFKDLKAAYEMAAKDLGNLRIIPSGEAFQNALKAGLRQLHRDAFHASIPLGRYILAAVWYEFFTANKIENSTYLPDNLLLDEFVKLKPIIHETIMSYSFSN